jgi:yeast amino acid transporter
MIAQGFDLTKNAYTNRLQPYIAYWGIFWTLFFVIINGFAVFWKFTAAKFLTACMYIRVQ